ncbi:hypothetical protein Patl1_23640 [Pistacia atlantica]|uniref:Uncharacterized protein n=1 Tax=Pistacia atlantica TaxID=434234 RepID=A0ACC0ZWT2_9ROSI|nr:hypothetical protein Patl1_23640 [Pistacia atlantica]
MGERKENVHELSVPSDIPVVDHAEVMLRDFKDYKGLKFLQSSSEATKASSSEMILEDNLPLEGRMPMVKNLFGEGKSDDHQQILNQVNPMIASLDANAVSMNDSGHHEKAIAQMGDVTGKDENESPRVESYEEIRDTTWKHLLISLIS